MITPNGEELAPDVEVLPPGTMLYRIFDSKLNPTRFNPGFGGPTRFAFFGTPPVPVLYASGGETSALCESLLHDIPTGGGALYPSDYINRAAARFHVVRPLRLVSLKGLGFKKLKTSMEETTASDKAGYARTVKWAQAVHAAGFDGISWMSYRCNTEPAVVLFGDRVKRSELELDPSYARAFANPTDRDWLVDQCGQLHVEVLS